MSGEDKQKRLDEIKKLVTPFCDEYLNDELKNYVFELSNRLMRKRKISITRGRSEIWASAVIYVIARLNFLFDENNPFYITPDLICNHFGTVKSTIGNKATYLEKICDIRMGDEGLCSPEISEMLTFVETPGGFVVPLNFLKGRIVEVTTMTEEEKKEFEAQLKKEKERKKKEEEEKRARKKAELFRKKHKNQLDLF